MNLFNQLANLNRPAVNDPKLSDFTDDELTSVAIMVDIFLQDFPTSRHRDNIEQFRTQLMNAQIVVRERERILNT